MTQRIRLLPLYADNYADFVRHNVVQVLQIALKMVVASEAHGIFYVIRSVIYQTSLYTLTQWLLSSILRDSIYGLKCQFSID